MKKVLEKKRGMRYNESGETETGFSAKTEKKF